LQSTQRLRRITAALSTTINAEPAEAYDGAPCYHARLQTYRSEVDSGCDRRLTAKQHTDDGRILNMEITEKQRAIEALQALPEHATIEDAIERLCFIAKIEEGLRQSDAGQLVSHDEVKKQFLS